jgi:hypothetical protein
MSKKLSEYQKLVKAFKNWYGFRTDSKGERSIDVGRITIWFHKNGDFESLDTCNTDLCLSVFELLIPYIVAAHVQGPVVKNDEIHSLDCREFLPHVNHRRA